MKAPRSSFSDDRRERVPENIRSGTLESNRISKPVGIPRRWFNFRALSGAVDAAAIRTAYAAGNRGGFVRCGRKGNGAVEVAVHARLGDVWHSDQKKGTKKHVGRSQDFLANALALLAEVARISPRPVHVVVVSDGDAPQLRKFLAGVGVDLALGEAPADADGGGGDVARLTPASALGLGLEIQTGTRNPLISLECLAGAGIVLRERPGAGASRRSSFLTFALDLASGAVYDVPADPAFRDDAAAVAAAAVALADLAGKQTK